MTDMNIEHLNVTVTDPDKTAELLVKLFGWHVRWKGATMDDGFTVHVGTEDSYLALYSPPKTLRPKPNNYAIASGLNHIGILVDDLVEVESRVRAEGITTHNYGDYEPGRRFYFNDWDGVEYEVVSYKK